jgi:23S rRNA (uridine2552-2'-O)-methyltransferase
VGPKGGLASDILPMAGRVLKPGGAALIKVFEGAGFEVLVGAARRQFKSVRFIKPAAARARSAETYLVASRLRLV